MAEISDQPVPQLSGGERQLMLLARAIAQNPHLLLLDEPTAHLDLRNKVRLIRLLDDLRAQGTTLLMTNNEPEVVLALADDVLLIKPDGEVSFGPLEEVFTAETLSSVYQIPIRLVDVDGHRQVLWT
jgi:iron complex transport system ATP-binding protein